MRWLAVWLVLTAVYLPGALVARRAETGGWLLDADLLTRSTAVPAVQTAALALVLAVRRSSGKASDLDDHRDPEEPAGT